MSGEAADWYRDPMKIRKDDTVRSRLPRSRIGRLTLGFSLLLGGLFGALPVLGFWMLPLGLLVLSYDLPAAQRLRKRLLSWLAKKRPRRR